MTGPQKAAAVSWLALLLLWTVVVRCCSESVWWVAALDSIPPQLWLALPLWGLWLAWVRRQWGWVALSALSAALLLGLAGLTLPHLASGTERNGLPVTVLSLNTEFASTDPLALARAAQASGAEVVALQEALNPQRQASTFAQRLNAAFPGWTLVRHDELVTLSRWPVEAWAVQGFPHSPHAVLVTHLRVRGQRLSVINTHLPTLSLLPSQSDQRLGRSLPQRVARRLAVRRDFLTVVQAAQANSGGRPTLLVGDFNAPPRGELSARLGAQGWTDAFRAAGQGFGFTHHARLGYARIDYVWLRGAWAESARVLPDVLSDHRALLVRVRLPVP